MSALLPLSVCFAVLAFAPQVWAQSAANPNQVLVERLEKASSMWMASCRRAKGENCAVVTEVGRKNACRASATVLQTVPRNRVRARKARAALQSALAAVPTSSTATSQSLEGAIAQARFFLAEDAFESLALLDTPRGLDFDEANPKTKKKSEERFLEYFARAVRETDEASSAYGEVLELENNTDTERWRLAALARTALVSSLFAEQLRAMEIPKDVRQGPHARDATAAFCDALEVPAQNLDDVVRAAAETCLVHPGATGDSLWGAECRVLQARIAPRSPSK